MRGSFRHPALITVPEAVPCVCPCGSVMVPAEPFSLSLESPSGLSVSEVSPHTVVPSHPVPDSRQYGHVGFSMSCPLPAFVLQRKVWHMGGARARGRLALPGLGG